MAAWWCRRLSRFGHPALIFGLAPAIRVSAADPHSTLPYGGRSEHLRRRMELAIGTQPGGPIS